MPGTQTQGLGNEPMAPATISRVVGYYSLSGVGLGHRAATLPAGVYMVRLSDGTYRKIHIN